MEDEEVSIKLHEFAKEGAAHHEAGHVALYLHFGISCTAWIKYAPEDDPDTTGWSGGCDSQGDAPDFGSWERAVVGMGGAIAEWFQQDGRPFFPNEEGWRERLSGSDKACLGNHSILEAAAEAERLLVVHKPEVDVIAQHLIQNLCLNPDDARRLFTLREAQGPSQIDRTK